jgi:hypothetical protein
LVELQDAPAENTLNLELGLGLEFGLDLKHVVWVSDKVRDRVRDRFRV